MNLYLRLLDDANCLPRRMASVVLMITVTFLPLLTFAMQDSQSTTNRIGQFRELTRNKVFRDSVTPNWLPGNEHFWYRVQTGRNQFEMVFVDTVAGIRQPAFDSDEVLTQLREMSGDPRRSLPNQIVFSEDRQIIFFKSSGYWRIDRNSSQLKRADEADYQQSVGSAANDVKPSTDRGGDVDLEFANHTEDAIRLIWIDRAGEQVPYDQINPGDSFRQRTFVGHVWLVVDSSNRPIRWFEAEMDETEIVIDSLTPLELILPNQEAQATRSRRAASLQATRRSPDGKWETFVQDHDLHVRNREDQSTFQLSQSGTADHTFEERVYWSPKSRFLLARQVSQGENRIVYMIESSPEDQTQPKLHSHVYAKPGDKIVQQTPRLFDLETRTDLSLDTSLFDNPWSISQYYWHAPTNEFRFLYNQRGHQVVRLVGISTAGIVRSIIDEQSNTFIDYRNKVFFHRGADDTEIIWMSERNGWNHLYLCDADTGTVKNAITSGEWVVRSIDRVDNESRQVWFQASGIVPGQDPYYLHFCRVNFDGSDLTILTEGDGTHSIEYSPDRKFLIDRYSRVDLPPQTNLRRTSDGSLVCHLESADWSALHESEWKLPTPFAAKGRDGQTDIYGVIYWPSDFEATQSYPVIESIYAGPHAAFVPKQFSLRNRMHELAQLGFIVVQIDGMGTNFRSKAFHDVCWKNLGDSGFPDRIAWLKQAAQVFPQMDLDRVGIYGGSAGGQSTLRGMLMYPDFYRVGVSDCGCHDNRVDKIWWNEQWMGWPIGPHYEEQSNVTQAHRLEGKLLLIVGELDRNVDPASTMQVVNALIKADKDFDLIVVPGAGHGIGSGRYGTRRTHDFFIRHLH